MAKHDQRILKFLNQNADRAPTITEMMTRLNISISDISDSLTSLQSQGLVAKKTNSQGIECWFPANSSQIQSMGQREATAEMRVPTDAYPMESRRQEFRAMDTRPIEPRQAAVVPERSAPIPSMRAEAPKPGPVPVQHLPVSEPSTGQIPSFQNSTPAFQSAPMFATQPAAKGVGMVTFIAGLAVAVVFSTWMAGRMASREVQKASRNFVEQKALSDANAAMADFQAKTKAHVTSLEDQIKKISDQLAAAKSAADSMKVAAAPTPTPTPTPAKVKGKASKAEVAKAEEPAPKAKAGKAKTKVKPSRKTMAAKPARDPVALARAAALRKRAASQPAAHSETQTETPPPAAPSDDAASSTPSSAATSAAAEPAPSVPEPPGANPDLPPPPNE